MVDLKIQKLNEVFIKIGSEPHIHQELSDHFTLMYRVQFMSQYRSKYWDGKIRLFSTATGQIYVGLLDKVISFCKNYNYDYKFVDNKYYGTPFETNDYISMEGVKDYMKSICFYSPRPYQVDGVYDALKHNRKAS